MGTINCIFIKQRIKILCYVAGQFLLAQRYVESSHKSLVYSLVARITRRQGLLEQSGERRAGGVLQPVPGGPTHRELPQAQAGNWGTGVHGEEGDKEGVPGSDRSQRAPVCSQENWAPLEGVQLQPPPEGQGSSNGLLCLEVLEMGDLPN